nr:hypothetical protein [Hahella ganghwensis]
MSLATIDVGISGINGHAVIECIGETCAVPAAIPVVLPTLPVTAVGKLYKPALRLLAVRRVLDQSFSERKLEVD